MKKLTVSSLISLLIFLAVSISASEYDRRFAKVTVYRQMYPDKVVYNYSVTNINNKHIIGFSVGFNEHYGQSQLTGPDPLAIHSPDRWNGKLIPLEESDLFEIKWEDSSKNETGPFKTIAPGETVTGFQIVVREDEPIYEEANWTMYFDGPPTVASDQLVIVAPPGENLPPRPKVKVTATPYTLRATGQWVPIKIQVSPIIENNPLQSKLLSVVCNDCEPDEIFVQDANLRTPDLEFKLMADWNRTSTVVSRVYTIRYEITNLQGGRVTEETTVEVVRR